jgi:hypothetical protein
MATVLELIDAKLAAFHSNVETGSELSHNRRGTQPPLLQLYENSSHGPDCRSEYKMPTSNRS